MYFEKEKELSLIQSKTGYIPIDPGENNSKIFNLEVISPVKWYGNYKDVEDLIPVGSLTWANIWDENSNSTLIEDNRYAVNFDTKCFRLIKKEVFSIEGVKDSLIKKEYRFKTKEEFIKDNNWVYISKESGYPKGFAYVSKMDKYIGSFLNEEHQKIVQEAFEKELFIIYLDGWSFYLSDFTEKKPGDVEVLELKRKEIEKVDLKKEAAAETNSSCPTIEQAINITKESFKKEDSNYDVVVESTVNITI
jgi:hypothetical protein